MWHSGAFIPASVHNLKNKKIYILIWTIFVANLTNFLAVNLESLSLMSLMTEAKVRLD